MKKIVRLTESDLNRIVEKILNEQSTVPLGSTQNKSLLPALLKFFQRTHKIAESGVIDSATYDALVNNKFIPEDKYSRKIADSIKSGGGQTPAAKPTQKITYNPNDNRGGVVR
jgi:hypothetical protein